MLWFHDIVIFVVWNTIEVVILVFLCLLLLEKLWLLNAFRLKLAHFRSLGSKGAATRRKFTLVMSTIRWKTETHFTSVVILKWLNVCLNYVFTHAHGILIGGHISCSHILIWHHYRVLMGKYTLLIRVLILEHYILNGRVAHLELGVWELDGLRVVKLL